MKKVIKIMMILTVWSSTGCMQSEGDFTTIGSNERPTEAGFWSDVYDAAEVFRLRAIRTFGTPYEAYWADTVKLVDKVSKEDVGYLKDGWAMYVGGKSPEDATVKTKRDVSVAQTKDTKQGQQIAGFSFHDTGFGTFVISFSYYKEMVSDTGGSLSYSVKIDNYDEVNQRYRAIYTLEADGKEVDHQVEILDLTSNEQTYEVVPKLNEAFTAIDTLLSDFKDEFDIDLEAEGLFNVARAGLDMNMIDQEITIEDPVVVDDGKIHYYSDVDVTASGHSYAWEISYVGNYEHVVFAQYDISSKAYAQRYDVTLEADNTNANLYMMKLRKQVIQKVMIVNNVIYVYDPEIATDEMINDVNKNKGQHAVVILTDKELEI